MVSCQNEKSQLQNKAAALRVLQSRLLEKARQDREAEMDALKGDGGNSWGSQMRSYVLHPYQMVKDLRTDYEVSSPDAVFDGDLDGFIESGIRWRKTERSFAPDPPPERGFVLLERRLCRIDSLRSGRVSPRTSEAPRRRILRSLESLDKLGTQRSSATPVTPATRGIRETPGFPADSPTLGLAATVSAPRAPSWTSIRPRLEK